MLAKSMLEIQKKKVIVNTLLYFIIKRNFYKTSVLYVGNSNSFLLYIKNSAVFLIWAWYRISVEKVCSHSFFSNKVSLCLLHISKRLHLKYNFGFTRERGRVKNNYYLVKQQNYERTKDSVVFIWGLGKAL